MNTYTNSNYEQAMQRRKKAEYRGILEEQIKQKKAKQSQERFQTEAQHNRVSYSPRYQSIEHSNASLKTRRLRQQKQFLPTIQRNQDRQMNLGSRHQRSNSYGNELSRIHEQDTDIQTLEALAECQTIIDNIRRLRMKSLSSMKRKQRQFSYQVGSPQSKSHRQEGHGRGAEQQVMMFRAWQPDLKHKSKKLKSKKSGQENNPQKKTKDGLDDLEDSGYIEQQQSTLPRSIKVAKTSADQQAEEGDAISTIEYKTQKRQKFLLKYLAKAKLRGSKLHQKISRYRNKTIAIPPTQQEQEQQQEQQLQPQE